MTIRAYQESDLPHIQRMWKEIGWATSPEEQAALEGFVQDADVAVGTINGEAEALASIHDGIIRYLETDLSLACVTAVTTSMIGRKQGFATETTARVVANALERGVHVAALGMFEQGFYNRLGFGTSAYTNQMVFDPSSLQVSAPYRTPTRLDAGDWEEVHAAHLRRKRSHGGVAINPATYMRAEMATDADGAGWGYYEAGRLTHFVWAAKKDYSGPLVVNLMSYEQPAQILELLALLREFGDQIRSVKIVEPPEIQLHDLLLHPIRQRIQTAKSPHEARHQTLAWWQMRILDLEHVVAQRSWAGDQFSFNLDLTDPLSAYGNGTGLDGLYRVTVGKQSLIETGIDPQLPTLTASIGAFSRLWFGVHPASSLALTDQLHGPDSLLGQLDEAFLLPNPHPGMFF